MSLIEEVNPLAPQVVGVPSEFFVKGVGDNVFVVPFFVLSVQVYSEGFGVLSVGQCFVNVLIVQVRQSFSYVLCCVHHHHTGALVCLPDGD